jgi:N utilization substance protein A
VPGSTYCGLPSHQALTRFETSQVAVLANVSEAEIAILADPDADEGQVDEVVDRAAAEFVEPVEEVEPVEGAETVPDTGVVDEVDETEATSEEAGPDAEHDEPGVEVVESGPGDAQPDVAAERDQTRASGSDCAAGGSPWTLGWLVALALAVLVSGRRRRARTG